MSRWTMDDIKATGLPFKVGKEEYVPVTQKVSATAKEKYESLGRMKSGKMNKTEAAYADLLEVQKRIGDVLWYQFEPMNLRLADKCFFKVDFMVLTKENSLEVHEVKGGFITDDSLVKIKTAAEKFPFRFLMKQLIKGEWITREF